MRDRGADGRPRNARPRDATGRPLPFGQPGIERIPDDLVLPPAETLSQAERYLAADQPFLAHELLEGAWKASPPDERDLWQGLAQVAVGLTHLQRGNARGAVTLLRRGADRIAPYAEAPRHDIDVAAVSARARDLASRAAQGGLDEADAAELRLTLRRGDDPVISSGATD